MTECNSAAISKFFLSSLVNQKLSWEAIADKIFRDKDKKFAIFSKLLDKILQIFELFFVLYLC